MTSFEHCATVCERGAKRGIAMRNSSGATAFLSLYLLQACGMTVLQAAQWSKTVAILLWFVLITTGALHCSFTVHCVRTVDHVGAHARQYRNVRYVRARESYTHTRRECVVRADTLPPI